MEKMPAPEEEIRTWLSGQIDMAVRCGFTTFITGMGMGTDLMAAQLVLEKRMEQNLHLIAAVPWYGFSRKWKSDWQEVYIQVFNGADYVHMVSPRFEPDVFERRDRWMVDHAARMIAVCEESRDILVCARECGLDVHTWQKMDTDGLSSVSGP